jgi:DNA-directed RNA polymerase subunit N (RpoN/RPB10)
MSHLGTTELPHIRCYTCNKLIGQYYDLFNELKSVGLTPEEAFEQLKIKKVCCRVRIANPAIISTAKYIEESDIVPDEEEEELEEDLFQRTIQQEKKKTQKEEETNKSKISAIQNRLNKLKAAKEESTQKPTEQKKTIQKQPEIKRGKLFYAT